MHLFGSFAGKQKLNFHSYALAKQWIRDNPTEIEGRHYYYKIDDCGMVSLFLF